MGVHNYAIAATSILLLTIAFGCNRNTRSNVVLKYETRFLVPLETLRQELHNPKYEWYGPCSVEDRIPVLHAARALAYWGDPAVPILIDAMSDPTIDKSSIKDALSEIGIPMHGLPYDSNMVQKWWDQNQDRTRNERDRKRRMIGLPPSDPDK